MSLTDYKHSEGDAYITELTYTDVQTAETYGHIPYHQLRLSVDDGEVVNNTVDTETITVEIINGLQAARNETPPDTLDYNGDVVLSIDGIKISESITGGSGKYDISTKKTAGSTIEVTAQSLSDKPAESDNVDIKVVSESWTDT
jgi:hypothetical protein